MLIGAVYIFVVVVVLRYEVLLWLTVIWLLYVCVEYWRWFDDWWCWTASGWVAWFTLWFLVGLLGWCLGADFCCG